MTNSYLITTSISQFSSIFDEMKPSISQTFMVIVLKNEGIQGVLLVQRSKDWVLILLFS